MKSILKYELALFAGVGGGILGSQLHGLQCVGAVEKNPYSISVLLRRQNEGYLPPFHIWTDIVTFRSDNSETRGYIKQLRKIRRNLIISAGFPCQDISRAGKGKGLEGENSGLWSEVIRLVREIGPAALLLENSTTLNRRGLDRILWELAKEGYDAVWDVFGANDTGAPQIRHRLWILSYTNGVNVGGKQFNSSVLRKKKQAKKEFSEEFGLRGRFSHVYKTSESGINWLPEPEVGRMVDGFPNRLVQRERLGDAQVPAVAAMALSELIKYTDLMIYNENYCSSAGKQLQSGGDSA